MAHLAPALATVVLMLLVSLLFPAFANPIALAFAAALTLGVTFVKDRRVAVVKDRRVAVGFAVVAVLGLALMVWTAVQPRYIGPA